jgi:hypothetical protein
MLKKEKGGLECIFTRSNPLFAKTKPGEMCSSFRIKSSELDTHPCT